MLIDVAQTRDARMLLTSEPSYIRRSMDLRILHSRGPVLVADRPFLNTLRDVGHAGIVWGR